MDNNAAANTPKVDLNTKSKETSPDEPIVCLKCGWKNNPKQNFCIKCGFNMSHKNPDVHTAFKQENFNPSEMYAVNKSPNIAILLSIVLPGVGQLYNGDNVKGIILLLIWLFLGFPSLGILWIACWIYGLVDAYNVSSRKKPLGKF